MNLHETLIAFDEAVKEFFDKDCDLLHRKLSERSITHRLALFLTPKFEKFHVDCEYNGDIDKEDLRKKLFID